MTESTVTALGPGKYLSPYHPHRRQLLDHQLRHPVSRRHGEPLLPPVQQNHADLATIVGIDRARSVGEADSMAEGKPATSTHAPLESRRNGHTDTGWNQGAPTRLDGDRHVETGADVKATGAGRHSLRKPRPRP